MARTGRSEVVRLFRAAVSSVVTRRRAKLNAPAISEDDIRPSRQSSVSLLEI